MKRLLLALLLAPAILHGQKTTDEPELTVTAAGDLIRIVDVSDGTDDVSGSTRKITMANLLALLHGDVDADGHNILGLGVADPTDATKVAKFSASGITTGTTRTFTFPDASGTFMLQLSDDATPSLGGDLAAGAYAINSADLTDVEILNFDAPETVTIATGVATVTQTNVILAAEGAGTTDTVDTITRSGLQNGDVVTVGPYSGDTITLANGTGNLDLGGDAVLGETNETLTLKYNGTNWVVIGHSPNILTVEIPASITVAASDETTALTAATGKVTFRMPYAMTLTEVRASVTTAPTGSTLIVDINEGGTTIFDTGTTGVRLTMDAGQKSTGSAAQTGITITTLAVMTDTALADNAEITVDVDQIGSTVAGAGLKVTLIGTRN